MEFLPQSTVPPPKNLYPCLATITVTPQAGGDRSRRMSQSSAGDQEDGNILKRIASGGRRKSDASQRRKSLVAGQSGQEGSAIHSTPATGGAKEKGTWYWRVQAGVSNDALILLPLTQPANPVLTSAPQPLSEAMPAHSSHTPGPAHSNESGHEEGLLDKMKSLFRKHPHEGAASDGDKVPHPDAAATEGGDRVIDQTATGEQKPTAKANAAGATNVNANAETGWPGVIDGEKLGMIAVPLHAVEKGKVAHGGGKKTEGYHITVPVTSQFAAMIAGFSDAGSGPKSGSIRLEFDHAWIGAKAESELLYYQITEAVSTARSPPSPTQHQLGSGARSAHPGGAAPGIFAGGAGIARGHDNEQSPHDTSNTSASAAHQSTGTGSSGLTSASGTGPALAPSGTTATPAHTLPGYNGAGIGEADPHPHHPNPGMGDRQRPSQTSVPVLSSLPTGYLGETTHDTTAAGHGVAQTAAGWGIGAENESVGSERKVSGDR